MTPDIVEEFLYFWFRVRPDTVGRLHRLWFYVMCPKLGGVLNVAPSAVDRRAQRALCTRVYVINKRKSAIRIAIVSESMYEKVRRLPRGCLLNRFSTPARKTRVWSDWDSARTRRPEWSRCFPSSRCWI